MGTRNCSMRLFCMTFIIFFEIFAIFPANARPNDSTPPLTTDSSSEQCASACSTACSSKTSGCLDAIPSANYSSDEGCTCSCAMTGCDITQEDPAGTSKSISVTCVATSINEVSCTSNDTAPSPQTCSIACNDECQFLMYNQECTTERASNTITNDVCNCRCNLNECKTVNNQNIKIVSTCTAGTSGTNCVFTY